MDTISYSLSAIPDSIASEDEKFDRRKHTLVPTLRTLDPLRSALDAIEPENVTLGLVCKVISLMDFVTKGLNEITGSHELHLQSDNLGSGLRIRFYATDGTGFNAFFDEEDAVQKTDECWTYKGDWIYERMRSVCMASGLELDLDRGGCIELTGDAETVAAHDVAFVS